MAKDPDDFEIGDVENFGGADEKGFSHSTLVAIAMKKCLENGVKEMREGWFNERRDSQNNIIKTYIEDTRKAFIESVRSLKMIMAGDLDQRAKDKLKKYFLQIKNKEKLLVKFQNDSWKNFTEFERINYLKTEKEPFGKILTNSILRQVFIEYELKKWRAICAELNCLTKRLDYYKSEVFEV